MIDVIVPVYAGEQETRACLASVMAARCETAFEILVVDDCSPEPSLSGWLEEQAAAGHITLLRHRQNLGFVAAVSAGMACHPARDVVLLNSDTEVANDWLDRMVACADGSPDIASVTPFSNNATICSYPYPGWEGGIPGGLGLARLDRLFAETLAGQVVDLPTAIGFCMLIRRACLDAVGGFDAAAFGRGYGEENDFSLRAAQAGWRNVLAADVFVYHHGAVSFGDGRFEHMRRAERTLLARHPDYNRRVAAFVAADPLRPLRDALDQARAACGEAEARQVRQERLQERTPLPQAGAVAAPACDRPVLLHLGHSWGGGVDRWIQDFAAADKDSWNLLLRSRTGRNAAGIRLELIDPAVPDERLLYWELDPVISGTAIEHAQYRQVLDDVVAAFGVEALVISSLIGHALDAFDAGLPTVVVLHDLYPFCPALYGWFGRPCQHCDQQSLERCLASNPRNVFWYQDDAAQWLALREAYAERLAAEAVRIAAPGRSVRDRYAALFPALGDKPWQEIAHGLAEPFRPLQTANRPPGSARRLRLLVPGRLMPHKGLHLFSAMVRELTEFAEVLLLGCGDFGLPFQDLAHLEVIPDYPYVGLQDHVERFAPDCALLLSTLPETFSYTLSEMAALGVPVIATRLGAFAERIEDGVDGFLVDPTTEAVLGCLRSLAGECDALHRVAAALRDRPVRTAVAMVADYRALLGLDDQGAGQRPRPGMLAEAVLLEASARRLLHEELQHRQRQVDRLNESLKTQQLALTRAQARADAQERRAAQLHDLHSAQCARGDALTAQLATLTAQLAAVEAARDAILTSSSWRLTRPLRTVKERLRPGSVASASANPPDVAVPPESAAQPAPPDAGPQPAAAPDPAASSDKLGHTTAPTPQVRTSDSATAAAAPVLPLTVMARAGDILGWARARWLEQALGVVGEAIPGRQPEPVPEGFSVVVYGAGPVDESAIVACFDGLEGEPSEAATALAAALDRVLMPSGDTAQRFRALWPQARAHVAIAPAPMLGHWPSTAERAAVRTRQRAKLGLPDRTRIVLGIGPVESVSGLIHFARLATLTCERRTDIRFVWLGARTPDWERAHWLDVGLPVALRHLFLVADRSFAEWLLAADAYVGCRGPGIHDAGVIEALGAGLPVCVETRTSLPDVLRAAPCDDLVDEASGEAAFDWLTASLDGTQVEADDAYTDRARRTLACWDKGRTAVDFVNACRIGSDAGLPVGDDGHD